MVDIRLPSGFDVNADGWRVLLQMKQDSSQNWQEAPMIALHVLDGVWYLDRDWHKAWTAPARTGVWTHWAFDVNYSSDPNKGQITIHADLDGNGSFETNASLPHVQTLLTQPDGMAGIPSAEGRRL
jgi:hypothetical protein